MLSGIIITKDLGVVLLDYYEMSEAEEKRWERGFEMLYRRRERNFDVIESKEVGKFIAWCNKQG